MEERRGGNPLDGSAPFYGTYACADGGFVAVGALEPQFYAALIAGLGIDDAPGQYDTAAWPATRQRFAAVFATRTRDEWAAVFDGTDACVTPVLSLNEAPSHPHNRDRESFTEIAGLVQPAPAPKLSRTPAEVSGPAPHPGQHTRDVLTDWGIDRDRVESLLARKVISEVG